jgi:hypothetical protein
MGPRLRIRIVDTSQSLSVIKELAPNNKQGLRQEIDGLLYRSLGFCFLNSSYGSKEVAAEVVCDSQIT